MLSPEQEEQVIAQALKRGLLKLEQVELHAPENRPPADPRLQSYRSLGLPLSNQHAPFVAGHPAVHGQPSTTSGKPTHSRRGFPTYGPRLDRLRKLGLIDDATIEEIRTDLRAMDATSDAETAVTSDEQPPVPGVDAQGPTPPTNTPAGGGPVTVRVQLPLPDALRRWTRYEITDVLGQGGMGVVYKARDRRLGRTVALKFIRLGDPKMVQRFLNEARAQARITHDNICKVYEVDEVASQPYIAMEYIDGVSVLSLNNQLSLLQKVRLIQDVAEALHSAHRIGIIHRDIKPQNVLVEQKPDGRLRPVLMDFGLARDVRSRLNITETGIVLGTPEYMSPEQARGTNTDGSVDCRTDVYSIGAMFYELLVGHPPFEGSTSVQVLISVINDEVIPVRVRNPGVPEPLETITMKCLSKQPDGRYPTARALAEDLGRFLAGEPIQAQPRQAPPPPPTAEPAPVEEPPQQRWGSAVLAGLLLCILAVMVVLTVRSRLNQAAERHLATEQFRHAQLFEKDVYELELFMRAAYALPLHNLSSEQDHVRQRVERIKAQLTTLVPEARGPAEYALGRAYMVLDQWTLAEQRLLAALQAGYDAPEVHFALGLTYGVRYQRAADAARRNPDRGWAAQRLAELEGQFLVAARTHLEKGISVSVESPAYAQALLQYYRRQYDAALASVARAAGEAPWLPEIVELEARILRERAAQSGTKELMLFAEYDLKRAGDILARAVDMARSNPFLYAEVAELRLLVLRDKAAKHESVQEAYEQVIDACHKALVAQPEQAMVYGLMASAEACISEEQAERGDDPRQALERGQVALTEAQRLAAGDTADLLTANRLNRVQIAYQLRRGQDAMPALLRAGEVAQEAAKNADRGATALVGDNGQGATKDSEWAALWVDFGRVEMLRADFQAAHGQDPRPDLEAASTAFQHVLAKQPQQALAHIHLGQAGLRLARRALEHGEDPLPPLQKSRESFAAALNVAPDSALAGIGNAFLQTLEAEYKLLTQDEPAGAIMAALQAARGAAKQYEKLPDAYRVLAQALYLEAQRLLTRGQDPFMINHEGIDAAKAGLKLRASDPELLTLQGELHLLAARWQLHQHRSPEPDLRLAEEALSRSLQVNDQRSATYLALAELAKIQTESAPPQEAGPALTRGLEATAKALDLSPGSPRALLMQGELLLMQAQRAAVSERVSIAEPALSALSQAVKLNPLLAREGGAARERAQELINDPHGLRVVHQKKR